MDNTKSRFKHDARRWHSQVRKELERWWETARDRFDSDHTDVLSYDEYQIYYKRLVFAFNGDQATAEGDVILDESLPGAMAEDWGRDSRGDQSVDSCDFYDSVFEVAINW